MFSQETEYKRTLSDEPLRKYLYEHHITPENYLLHEAELQGMFPGPEAWQSFVRQYLTPSALISFHRFMKEGQRFDVFPHPRYIQQDFHLHDFFEMKYQLAGSGTVFVDDQTLFLRKSDICIIAPYVPHRNEVYTDDAVMINFVLPAEFLADLFPRLTGFQNGFRAFFRGEAVNPRWLHMETENHPAVRQIASDILSCFVEGRQHNPLRRLSLEADLERMFLLILESEPEFYSPESARETRNRMVAQVVDYIRANLQEVSLTDIVSLLHFSPSYVSRLIRRQTGFTFQMLLLTLRMEEAARQLKETDLPVDQIAANVGLTGRTYFYDKFRGIYGVTPGAFRRQSGTIKTER